MPVEIRELIIKVTVEEQRKKKEYSDDKLQELKKQIVADCVNIILNKIEQTTER